MSAMGTLLATAALSIGVVSAIKAVRRRAAAKRRDGKRPVDDASVIELEVDRLSGVWRDPKAASVAD